MKKSFYKNLVILFFVVVVFMTLFSSCVKEIEDETIVATTNTTSMETSEGLIKREKISKPTINLDDFVNVERKMIEDVEEETTENLAESEYLERVRLQESYRAKIDKIKKEEQGIVLEESLNAIDLNKINDDRVIHRHIEIDTSVWNYGMTPIEWVYIEPNIQIVSNYKPNSSTLYSVNSKVSSGELGCYIPVFMKCDALSNDYDGRFYCFADYSKEDASNMTFSNSLADIMYKGQSVEQILRKEFMLSKTANGLLKNEMGYVNIVYLTDLNKILAVHG